MLRLVSPPTAALTYDPHYYSPTAGCGGCAPCRSTCTALVSLSLYFMCATLTLLSSSTLYAQVGTTYYFPTLVDAALQVQTHAAVGAICFAVVGLGLATRAVRPHQLKLAWWCPIAVGVLFSLSSNFESTNIVRARTHTRTHARTHERKHACAFAPINAAARMHACTYARTMVCAHVRFNTRARTHGVPPS
jgi:hypothetical protein